MKNLLLFFLIILVLCSCKQSTEQEDDAFGGFVLLFNGYDSYLELPKDTFNDLAVGSVELWINAYNFERDVFYKETFHANTISCLRINADGRIQCSHENYLSYEDVISNTALRKGRWYHIGWTWNGTNQNIYIDGILDKTQPCIDGVANHLGEWLRLGRGDSYFDGKIDDFRIWENH